MATVTGLTAARMLEIEAQSVVSGVVEDDDLILVRYDGSTITAGNVRGPAGEGGSGVSHEQTFNTASNIWVISHNKGTTNLSVQAWDLNGDEIEGDVSYIDDNTIEIEFYYPQSGIARAWN